MTLLQRRVGSVIDMTAAPQAAPRAVLLDRFGRTATDLRISLTDRCSLRCTYCMPAEGLDWLSRSDRLTDDEILRLAEIFVGLGVESIRLTGGEPLVHRTVVDVVARLASLEPRPELSLTTNGISLDRSALDLVRAGLDRVNVSIDTLDAERFRTLTRRDRLAGRVARCRCCEQCRARTGEDQLSPDARLEPRRGTATARLGTAARIPVALHRAHAAGRRPQLDAGQHGHRGRGARPAAGRLRALAPRARR